MTTKMKIDFVSDVSCPWCVVGLRALEQAIERVGDQVQVELHFQPFELNPKMATGGQDIVEHITEKYGSSPAQVAANGEAIRARGAALGFTFNMDKRGRIYNTFDAHRLLHWAELEGRQFELKTALFEAYFTDGLNPSDHAVLVELARKVGLDADKAREILDSDAYAADVRAQEQFYHQQGINAVPAVIINDRHLISGGQPVEVFEQALRQIAETEAA
jgi:predicted DsbA family dithiol-disulfide isomerase